MKTFENTLNKHFTFSSCSTCEALCCDGRNGTIFSQLILEDFEGIFQNFPIVFILGDLKYLKPVVLLTNGKENCRYLKNDRCSIYEQRPTVCKVYPLSPHLTNIPFIDLSCPAVNDGHETIVRDALINSKYSHEVFDNYQEKHIAMHFHFDKFNKVENLEVLGKIGEYEFFKFKEDLGDSYIKMHLSSLKNFDEYFKS